MNPSTSLLAEARTFLFVPGNRPERFDKALRAGADAVVIDLEDAVPLSDKPGARDAIAQAMPALLAQSVPVVVRINPPGQPTGQQDIAWLAGGVVPHGIMLPKAESAEDIDAVRRVLPGTPILPLIESAAGYAALDRVAGADGVLRLAVGHIDFMADTGIQCSQDETELAPLRFAVTMATRLHRLAPAIDGVTAAIDDAARLRDDTLRALRFGFGGKLCIHPRQIDVVHDSLVPDAQAVAWARRVVAADAASGGAAVQLDGRMIDLPVVLQARRTLARLRA